MIQIDGLRKTYGDHVAVDDLTLSVRAGEVTALLGPNGAGKTTTILCVAGLLQPDRGTVRVLGHDVLREPIAARQHLAYLPELANVYEALTPVEFLQLKGRLWRIDEAAIATRVERLLRGFDLWERRNDAMATFSKGMVQRVAIASALLIEPRVLVLDEPLSGLDVETSMVVKEVVREVARGGATVLYCSHVLDVVETVADRVVVLDRGRMVAQGTLQELRQRAGQQQGRLEQLFRELTLAADPTARARAILG